MFSTTFRSQGARALRAALSILLVLLGLGLTAAPPAGAVGPGPPITEVAVSLNPAAVTANGTSTGVVSVTVTSVGGVPVEDATVTITSSHDVTFLNDLTYTGSNGVYTQTFKASITAEIETITASATNGTTQGGPKTGSADLTENPGPPTHIDMSLVPALIPANGTATSDVTAIIRDANGNPVPNVDVQIGLQSGDVEPVGQQTGNGVGAYFRTFKASTTPGTNVINATGGGRTTSIELFEYGPAASISLALNPTSIVADGTSTSTATATVKDAGGNPIPDQVVTITTNGDAGVGSVTDHDDGTYTAVITSSTSADTETITASTGALTPATKSLTETPGPVASISLALDPASIVANGTSTSTAKATLEDANGNGVSSDVVSFTTDGDAKIGTTTNNNDGTYTATITSSITADTETITAKAVGADKTDTADLTETPGPVSAVTVELDPNTLEADGTSTSDVTVTVKDAKGNVITGETVTLATDGDADLGDGSTTDNGDGTYTATLTASTTADTETITATATGANKTGTATLTETPGPADTVELTLDPTSIVADGTSTSTATATVKDVNGNGVSGETVAIVTDGDADVSSVTDNGDGTYTATITSSTTADDETITATDGALTDTATLTEVAGPPVSLVLDLDPSAILADGSSTSTATATVMDVNGNGVSGETVAITGDGDVGIGTVTDNDDGTYTATITSSTTTGPQDITATDGALTDFQTLTLFGAATTITVQATPNKVPADGTTTGTLKATLADKDGNPVANAAMAFGTDGDIAIGATTNHGDGTYTAPFTASSTPETETITATGSGKSGTTQIVEWGPADSVVVTLSPNSIVADGTSTSTATATLKDANGVPVPNEVVSFTRSGDVVLGTVTNNGDGTYTTIIKSSKTADTETITATATGAGKSNTAQLTETPGPASAVTVNLNPTSIVANGTSTSTATAIVKDVNGNLIKNAVVTLTTTAGDVVPQSSGATTNNNNGTYTGTIKASRTAGVNTIKAAVTGSSAFGTATLTEVPGAVSKVTVVLSPSTMTADGTSTSTATATVADANGNAIKGQLVSIKTDGESTVGKVTDKGDGTYTATITASKTEGEELITATAVNAGKSGTALLTLAHEPTGYWLTGADGGVFSFGDAGFFGSIGGHPLNEPVVGMVPTTDRKGYWQVANDGGVFAYGDAPFLGSMGGKPLNEPVVGMAATPDGKGYWLVALDGGIFSFGNAGFYGSMGGMQLNGPVVGMVPTATGKGYWLIALDGGVFAFGDASFVGSLGGTQLEAPIISIAPTKSGKGYWMVALDGGVFAFGDAPFFGSAKDEAFDAVIGISPIASGRGYRLVDLSGFVYEFGDATFEGDVSDLELVSPITGIAGF